MFVTYFYVFYFVLLTKEDPSATNWLSNGLCCAIELLSIVGHMQDACASRRKNKAHLSTKSSTPTKKA
jgi:hypothetical protein